MEDNKNIGNNQKSENKNSNKSVPKNRNNQKPQRTTSSKSNSRIIPAKKRPKNVKAKRNLVSGDIDIPIPKKNATNDYPDTYKEEKREVKEVDDSKANFKQKTISIPNPLYNDNNKKKPAKQSVKKDNVSPKIKKNPNIQQSDIKKEQNSRIQQRNTEPTNIVSDAGTGKIGDSAPRDSASKNPTPRDSAPRKKKKSMAKQYFLLIILIVVISVCTVIYATLRPKHIKIVNARTPKTSQTDKNSKTKNTNGVVATANVLSTGNLIIDNPVLKIAQQSDSTYNFNSYFENIKPLVTKADMAVCNLVTTFGGTQKKYTGEKVYNSPDSVASAVKKSGFDVVLTANEHAYDSQELGMKRTLNFLENTKLQYTGTKLKEENKSYLVKDVNGIKIGMINYTYETLPLNGKKSLNNKHLTKNAGKLVNSFNYNNLDIFYKDAKEKIDAMKKDGAQAIMFYINWGDYYKAEPNSYQKAIAKKMCEFDVDVLIGTHPRVLQPVEVLENKDHKMVCMYSVGNLLSSQTRKTTRVRSGKTEDGLLFYTKFEKYANGKVRLAKIDCIPTWVNSNTSSKKQSYQVVPIEDSIKSENDFSLAEKSVKLANESYERTMAVVKRQMDSFNSSQKESIKTETTKSSKK